MLEIIALACLVNLWIHSEPTNFFRYWIYKSVKDKDALWHWRLINCALCTGFWFGLLVTLNIYSAALVAVAAEFICKKLTVGL